ncbi:MULTISPECIES: DUF3102 domain-containing protein [Dehalobacter]|uniref:DUF3102 domain-containing protein n=1 Tax=Dehalobacter TaxID=56112 RepID=UPI00083A547A|nr:MULTISPECIES: DUF3102 domain-containing protein [Dehalobacter]OCZ52098.1 hypothetical protein A7D23_11690 [Dehalobacter sp. TeCB1]
MSDSNLSFSQTVILLGIPAQEREEFMACRKKALEIAANMVKTLQEYPPAIRTNLAFLTTR